ncbi:MAG: hypothetical protein AMXMBFR64_47430 [Myxococcales bacterium]
MTGPHEPLDEPSFATALIERIVRECPRRQAGSPSERRAQRIAVDTLRELGVTIEEHPFRFSDNLYAVMALHFGMGVLGTLVGGVAPLAGAALRGVAAGSYLADSARAGYLLRRLLKQVDSQNLVATLPATTGEPRLRIVFLAHADAAFTGWVFDPRVIERLGPAALPPSLRFMGRSLAVATVAEAIGATLALVRAAFGPVGGFLRPAELLLAIPGLIAFLLNLQVVLRNEVVPGATDDLSGVAGVSLLARRLAATKRPDVELVFVFTGAEEAGTGGAYSLARDRRQAWDPANTLIIGLDGLSNGELCWLDEGEIVRAPLPAWLDGALRRVATGPFAGVAPFDVVVGATDVYPFRRQGYDGVCIGCVDRSLGAPRHYHVPTDTPQNVDPADITRAVDFAEALVGEVVRERLG